MTTSGRQAAVRRRTVVAIAIAATVILPLALPAGAENLSSGTAAVAAPPTAPVLDTVDKGSGTATGAVQQLGTGTPLQPVTNTASATAQKTVTGATGSLRQPANPAPNVAPNPQPGAPGEPMSAAANASPAMSDAGPLIPSGGSASGLRVDAAMLLLAQDVSAPPLVAEALAASPSALVLVAEPLARSLNLPLGNPQGVATSDRTQAVQASRNLPQGLLTEALIAVALLVAATAALVAELGLKRSAPRAT